MRINQRVVEGILKRKGLEVERLLRKRDRNTVGTVGLVKASNMIEVAVIMSSGGGSLKEGDLVEGEITREVAGRRKNLNLKDSPERGETGWQRVVGVTRRKRTVLKGSKA